MSEARPTVLFACNWNIVRSPMAAALLERATGGRWRAESCGLQPGEAVDPFARAVMAEAGLEIGGHRPKGFEAVDDGSLELVVALTPESRDRARRAADQRGVAFEYWPSEDPTVEHGSREHRLQAYRRVRDDLRRRIEARFGPGEPR